MDDLINYIIDHIDLLPIALKRREGSYGWEYLIEGDTLTLKSFQSAYNGTVNINIKTREFEDGHISGASFTTLLYKAQRKIATHKLKLLKTMRGSK